MDKKSERATINLYNEDCLPAMRKMADNQYSLAIVDPPYGINTGKKKTIGKRGKTHIVTKYKQSNWDFNIPSKEYFKQLFRISENQIIWGGNYFIQYLFNTRCVLFWSKQYIPAGFSMADCEMAWTSFNESSKMVRVPIEHNCVSNNPEKAKKYAKIHQAQKPVALYKWLLKNYAKPGDTILDTHGGSMSIAIACWDAGHDLDLYEIDHNYFEAGKKRLENHKAQLQLY